MNIFTKIFFPFMMMNFFLNSIAALEDVDRIEIEQIIRDYTDS
jgi:hypothetical protein